MKTRRRLFSTRQRLVTLGDEEKDSRQRESRLKNEDMAKQGPQIRRATLVDNFKTKAIGREERSCFCPYGSCSPRLARHFFCFRTHRGKTR